MRVLTKLCSAIQANGAQLPPLAAVTLDKLQDELSALFPAPTPVMLSPVRQIIPNFQVLTRQIQAGPQYNVALSLPIAENQRVGCLSIAHDEQRVVSKPTVADVAESSPTLIPFQTIPPPGRLPWEATILHTPTPNHADNLPRTTPKCPKTSPPMVPTITTKHSPGQASSATTHSDKWQVKRVVQHRGKITHRSIGCCVGR